MFASLFLSSCVHDTDDENEITPKQNAVKENTQIRTVVLHGAQQVPGIETNAAGFGSFEVDTVDHTITGTVYFTGITTSAAHIHTGAAGASGGPVITLIVDNDSHKATVPEGSTLTHQQLEDFLAGNHYVNLHSSSYSSGEIRGQIGRVVMTASLDGDQQVPVVATGASGTALIAIDPEALDITGGANFSGVTATSAHIHNGAKGDNGSVVTVLNVNNTTGIASVNDGVTLTRAQYDNLRAGKLYFNIHSDANTGGEIRGQIGPVVVLAQLSGDQLVSPVTTNATGRAVFVVNPVTLVITGGVSFEGVNATAAHIHTGASGTNGGVAVALTVDSNNNTAVVPDNTVLTQAQFDDLVAGNTYALIHSTTYAAGEIRGQLSLQ